MSYVKDMQIGQFAGFGLGAGNAQLWTSAVSGLKNQFKGIGMFSSSEDLRYLMDQWNALVSLTNTNIANKQKATLIVNQIKAASKAYNGKWKKEKSKTWIANEMVGQIGKLQDIYSGKKGGIITKTVTKVVEKMVPGKTQVVTQIKEIKSGVPTTAIMVGAGALVVAFMLMKKK